jgi:chemotaxis family two-component system sensor kinase Cph1
VVQVAMFLPGAVLLERGAGSPMLGPPDRHPSPELLFEQSSDPVFILDPREDRILDANAAGCRVLGYTREELLATSVSDIHPYELPQMRSFVEAALLDGESWTIEMACRTKSGTFLPTEMALLAFDSGSHVYLVGLLRDRSEHRG